LRDYFRAFSDLKIDNERFLANLGAMQAELSEAGII